MLASSWIFVSLQHYKPFNSNQYDKVRNSSEERPADERRSEGLSADLTNHTYKSDFEEKNHFLNRC